MENDKPQYKLIIVKATPDDSEYGAIFKRSHQMMAQKQEDGTIVFNFMIDEQIDIESDDFNVRENIADTMFAIGYKIEPPILVQHPPRVEKLVVPEEYTPHDK